MSHRTSLHTVTRQMRTSVCFAYPLPSAAKGLHAVKVCGLVSPEDADMVARAFREIVPHDVQLLLGMILWPNSRRSVSRSVACNIAKVADKYDATAVGVFVDEDVITMERICSDCGITVAQLHGPNCRYAWSDRTHESSLDWIDVRDVSVDGSVSTETSSCNGPPLFSLFDAKGGGTGKPFDWNMLVPPSKPWLLAGGLNPANVAQAVEMLQPSGVDVATGVSGPDKCSKDERLTRLFLENLIDAYS